MKLPFLYTAVIFVLIPVSAARPMTSLYAQHLQASMLEIGVITAMYSLTPLLIAISAGRLVDRFGARLPILGGSLGIGVSLILPFLIQRIEILYITQLILGGSQLFAVLAIQYAVAHSTTAEKRDQVIGNFTLFTSFGMLLGPLIGGYASEHLGFEKSFLFLSIIPIVSLIIALTKFKSQNPKESADSDGSHKSRDLLHIPDMSRFIVVSMITLSALDIFFVYFPLYAKSAGLSLSQIGWILTIQGTGSSFARVIMSRLVERFGRVQILWVFMLMGAIAFGSIPLYNQFFILALCAAVLGLGLGVSQPLTLVLSYNAAPEGRAGEVLGLRLAANRFAQTIIPFLLANVSQIIGLGAIFAIKSLALAVGAMLAKKIDRTVNDPHLNQEKRQAQI